MLFPIFTHPLSSAFTTSGSSSFASSVALSAASSVLASSSDVGGSWLKWYSSQGFQHVSSSSCIWSSSRLVRCFLMLLHSWLGACGFLAPFKLTVLLMFCSSLSPSIAPSERFAFFCWWVALPLFFLAIIFPIFVPFYSFSFLPSFPAFSDFVCSGFALLNSLFQQFSLSCFASAVRHSVFFEFCESPRLVRYPVFDCEHDCWPFAFPVVSWALLLCFANCFCCFFVLAFVLWPLLLLLALPFVCLPLLLCFGPCYLCFGPCFCCSPFLLFLGPCFCVLALAFAFRPSFCFLSHTFDAPKLILCMRRFCCIPSRVLISAKNDAEKAKCIRLFSFLFKWFAQMGHCQTNNC